MNAPLTLKKTPLHALHAELGAKMVPFAGYDMPVQYPLGVMKEHVHTREKAGLFDVSHMGQAKLIAHQGDAAVLFEELVPGGITSLKDGFMRYTQLTDEKAGILDDLMATRFGDTLWLVVNAACKDTDFAHIAAKLDGRATLEIAPRALLALQGPKAEAVLAELMPVAQELLFMQGVWSDWQGAEVLISRCGYTGEDGYEISIAEDKAEALAKALLAHDDVEAIGLGARDSLRLEAGLCLYGRKGIALLPNAGCRARPSQWLRHHHAPKALSPMLPLYPRRLIFHIRLRRYNRSAKSTPPRPANRSTRLA